MGLIQGTEWVTPSPQSSVTVPADPAGALSTEATWTQAVASGNAAVVGFSICENDGLITPSPSTGWTVLADRDCGGFNHQRAYIVGRMLDGTADDTLTLTLVGGDSRHMVASLMEWSNVASITPNQTGANFSDSGVATFNSGTTPTTC